MAMVVPPGCLVGIPAGILAMAALSKAEVKAAFAAGEKSSPEAFSPGRMSEPAAWIALAALWLGGGALRLGRLRRTRRPF